MSPLLVAHLAGSYLTMGLFFAPRLYHFPSSEPLDAVIMLVLLLLAPLFVPLGLVVLSTVLMEPKSLPLTVLAWGVYLTAGTICCRLQQSRCRRRNVHTMNQDPAPQIPARQMREKRRETELKVTGTELKVTGNLFP